MTEEDTKDSYIDRTARIISVAFHPVFMPVYGLLLIFSVPTLFGYLPFNVKKIILSIVLLNNVLLPLSLLPYLKYRNQITSWTMESRKERILPLFLATILYAATTYMIIRYPVPLFIKTFIVGIFFVSLALTAINLWWKISVHASACGALSAMIIILTFRMNSYLLWPLITVIVVSGLILSARLKLNAHSSSEVWAGYFLGIAVLSLLMGVL
jgi:hypothetical protein